MLQGQLTPDLFKNAEEFDDASAEALALLGGGFSIVLENIVEYDDEKETGAMARLYEYNPQAKARIDEGVYATRLETTFEPNLNLVRQHLSARGPPLSCSHLHD